MPIISNIKASSFASEIRNFIGATNKLKAGISELVQCTFDIELFWYVEPLDVEVYDNGGRIIIKSGQKFPDNGFSIGDSISFQAGFTAPEYDNATGNITAISEDGTTIFTDINTLQDIVWTPSAEVLIVGTTVLEDAYYNFGLIENQEPFNIKSKLTGEDQGYYFKNIAGPIDGIPLGSSRSWQNDITGVPTVTIERLANTNIPITRAANFGGAGGVVVQNTVLNYRVIHYVVVMPYYTADQLSNIQKIIAPNFLAGTNSLKYVFSANFKKTLSDEDSNKIVEFSSLQGSVGFYDENFNGIQTVYSKDSIAYTIQSTGLPNDNLLFGGVTEVEAVVSRDSGSFTGTEEIIVSHSYLPTDESVYLNTEQYIEENLLLNRVREGASNNIVKNVTTTLINATTLQINFDVDLQSPAGLNGQKLDETDNYLLAVLLDTPSLSSNESDRTNILLDVNVYDSSKDIPDLLIVDEFTNYDHGTDVTEVGFTDYKGWIQDGYTVKGNFRLDRTKEALIETFNINLVAWKDGTNEYFLIQRNQFNVSNAVIDNDGNQQINIEELQGFKLDTLDQFNQKVLTTGIFDGTFINYDFQLGLKIDWQEWVSLPDADTVFYDINESNNGLNKDSSNYSLKEGYTLMTIIDANISNPETTTQYIHKSELIANDFGVIGDQDWQLLPIETFDSSLENLSQSILTGEETIIKAEFQPNFAITPVLDDYYGIIRIEKYLSTTDKEIYELSSVRSAPVDNLLIPLELETVLKLSLNGNNIVLECRTDSVLIENVQYNLYARLGLKEAVVSGEFNDDFSNDFFV